VIGVERVIHMHGFTPFTGGRVPEGVPDILRVADGIILGVVRMVLADKEKNVAIGRDGRPQFGQPRINVLTDVLHLDDGL
jgi:hypothetical protein